MSVVSAHSNVVIPAVPPYTLKYATHGKDKVVQRWNPCRAHTYKVNLSAVPAAYRPTMLAETHAAIRVLAAKSGIPFVYKGATGEVPQPGSLASQSAELIIAYATPASTRYPLSGSVVGTGAQRTNGAARARRPRTGAAYTEDSW
jgi:hypothetical protein